MWSRWNTHPIVVQGFPALPAEVVPGPPIGSTAPFIRARDAVSAPTRGRSAVSDATAAELLWVHLRSLAAGVVRPRERPPPAHQAPPEAATGSLIAAGRVSLARRIQGPLPAPIAASRSIRSVLDELRGER
jgi:hypothetical protein